MLQCRHFLGIAMEMPYSSGVHDYGRVKLPGFVASLSRKPKHFKHFSLLIYIYIYIIGSCSYKIMFIAEWINCYWTSKNHCKSISHKNCKRVATLILSKCLGTFRRWWQISHFEPMWHNFKLSLNEMIKWKILLENIVPILRIQQF